MIDKNSLLDEASIRKRGVEGKNKISQNMTVPCRYVPEASQVRHLVGVRYYRKCLSQVGLLAQMGERIFQRLRRDRDQATEWLVHLQD